MSKVLAEYVGYTLPNGESVVIPKGEDASGAPAADLKFWREVGMVEPAKKASTRTPVKKAATKPAEKPVEKAEPSK